MTPSKAQADTVARLVKGLELDARLLVRVTMDPDSNMGLLVQAADHWEVAQCRVLRNGDCEALEPAVMR